MIPLFIFIALGLLFLGHQIAYYPVNAFTRLLDNYLDPLLLMPLLLYMVLWEKRLLFNKAPDFVLSDAYILSATVSISIMAEVVFPHLTSRFTADFSDVGCYAAGALFYRFFMNKPGSSMANAAKE